MLKISLNHKTIYLTPDIKSLPTNFLSPRTLLVFGLRQEKILNFIDLLLISETDTVLIEGPVDENLALLKSKLHFIQAGGGVVFNNRNELLFIFRKRKWDLPKGKQDYGESMEQCARREVREETGLRNLELVRPLDCTYHIYIENRVILKETHWYLMYSEDHRLRPQQNEGITRAVWVHKNNIRKQLQNTYPAILDLFDKLLNE